MQNFTRYVQTAFSFYDFKPVVLRWLETVSSIFQDLEFDGSL